MDLVVVGQSLDFGLKIGKQVLWWGRWCCNRLDAAEKMAEDLTALVEAAAGTELDTEAVGVGVGHRVMVLGMMEGSRSSLRLHCTLKSSGRSSVTDSLGIFQAGF